MQHLHWEAFSFFFNLFIIFFFLFYNGRCIHSLVCRRIFFFGLLYSQPNSEEEVKQRKKSFLDHLTHARKYTKNKSSELGIHHTRQYACLTDEVIKLKVMNPYQKHYIKRQTMCGILNRNIHAAENGSCMTNIAANRLTNQETSGQSRCCIGVLSYFRLVLVSS